MLAFAHLAREGIYAVATTRADAVAALDEPAPPWAVRVKRESVAAFLHPLPFLAHDLVHVSPQEGHFATMVRLSCRTQSRTGSTGVRHLPQGRIWTRNGIIGALGVVHL